MAELPRTITAMAFAFVWIVVFGAFTYWAGEFKLLPGERRKLAESIIGGVLLALGFALLVQVLPPEVEAIVVPLSVLASLMLLPYAQRRVDKYVRERPPEERAELERRQAFFRKPFVFIGFAAGAVLMAVIFTILVR